MASTPAWPNLKSGNSGKNVSALQCLLVYHGYSVSIDGSFGPATKTAVTNFQSAKGLSADGIAGQGTLSNMVVTVQNGTNHYGARAAQYLLSKFESISIDGAFGNGSASTARTFQSKMGLSSDGIIGPTAWQYLFGYNAYPSGQDTPAPSGTIYCSNSYLSMSQMKVNAQYILDYLRARGWTKNAVCGMLGNMQTESTINPGIWEGLKSGNTSRGFGLVQWTPATKYFTWADNNNLSRNSIDSQLQRIIYEKDHGEQFYATPTYNMTFKQFATSTSSASYLACVFLHNYERPANSNQDQTRGNQATYWFNNLV